jgi:SAM-dependent methyltransferase
MEPLAAAEARYAGADLRSRWPVWVRRRISGFRPVEARLPRAGEILEVGCGHGLFSHFAALAAPGRRLVGVDVDARKIEVAQRTAWARARFLPGDALDPPAGPWDAVVIVDVLYLLDAAAQARALAAACRVLKPGGLLVWKAQEPAGWKHALALIQEWLATRSGLTAGRSLTFLPRAAAVRYLEEAGFVEVCAEPVLGRIYSEVIYTARRPTSP